MVHLQQLHDQYAGQGLVILGFDSADQSEIAEALLDKYDVTYRSILDPSDHAKRVATIDYGVESVPTTYVIDREGRVADAWIGYQENDTRSEKVLRRLGIE